MNSFEETVSSYTGMLLHSRAVSTIQVNVGLKCNQRCRHCHVEASPERTEEMTWPVMEMVIQAAGKSGRPLIDITGGSPELNTNLKRFIKALRKEGFPVQVRTNLTAMLEPGQEATAGFFKDNKVTLLASLPCYLEKDVDEQRGDGVYQKSIKMMEKLNSLGYGIEPELPLSLIYNPIGPDLPPDQRCLEADFRRELSERFGIQFNDLLTITNMPIGRFKKDLSSRDREKEYLGLLLKSFNPKTIDILMCRTLLSVGWDGTLYDCDFNLALGMPVNHGAPDRIENFDLDRLASRKIVTGVHCFGCTAGAGSS